MSRLKLVAIVGPTMAGKSDLGIKLATEFSGAIISADSRAVYEGLDVGTNKPTVDHPSERLADHWKISDIDHYGFDLVKPGDHFTVKDFQAYAQARIAEITARDQVPFLVGGSSLYATAVIDQFDFANGLIDTSFPNLSIDQILAELKKIDPGLLKSVDQANRRRLEPLLALARQGKRPIASRSSQGMDKLLLVVYREREILYERSDKQIKKWLSLGLVNEVEKLRHKLNDQDFKQLGLVYYLTWQYLNKLYTREEYLTKLKFGLHGLIRRQLTWWRRRPDAHWVSSYNESKGLVAQFLGEDC